MKTPTMILLQSPIARTIFCMSSIFAMIYVVFMVPMVMMGVIPLSKLPLFVLTLLIIPLFAGISLFFLVITNLVGAMIGQVFIGTLFAGIVIAHRHLITWPTRMLTAIFTAFVWLEFVWNTGMAFHFQVVVAVFITAALEITRLLQVKRHNLRLLQNLSFAFNSDYSPFAFNN
jgi:hypothetical protein